MHRQVTVSGSTNFLQEQLLAKHLPLLVASGAMDKICVGKTAAPQSSGELSQFATHTLLDLGV